MKYLVATIVLLVLLLKPAAADLVQVQAAIKENNALWVADENDISKLSDADIMRLCGVKVKLFERRPLFSPSGEYPFRVDWREKAVTSIKNQGGCGSCWAFAGVATLESLYLQNNLGNFDLSEQFLLSCSDGDCSGWYVEDTANFIRDKGTILESELPYQATDSVPCPSPSRLFKSLKWEVVTEWGYNNENYIIPAVATCPVPTVFKVYRDFTYYKEGIYEHVSGGVLGWHAVLIVGYDIAEKYFIVKNSWGQGWGEKGFFRIRFQDSCFGYATQVYSIDVQPPSVSMKGKLSTMWGKVKNGDK